VIVLLARDVIVTVSLAALKRRGVTGVTVTYAGKLATFTLTIGLPLLLVANLLTNQLILGIAWAFIVWGTALYWYSGWQYFISARTKFA
jgi:cardiolipin synthase